jgi:hypothetical protein
VRNRKAGIVGGTNMRKVNERSRETERNERTNEKRLKKIIYLRNAQRREFERQIEPG